jgi:signal transduction histidine kinase
LRVTTIPAQFLRTLGPCVVRAWGSLRRRFLVLLVVMAAATAGPWWLVIRAQAHLQGAIEAVDAAGALRSRLLQVLEIAEHHDASARPRLAELVAAQRRALVGLIGSRCQLAAFCDRLRQHLERLDREIVPALAGGSGEPVPPQAMARLSEELPQLDETVHVLARAHEQRLGAVRRCSQAALVASLFLVVLLSIGVWEVFWRIRRLENAARTLAPDAGAPDSGLARLGTGVDEVASLARTVDARMMAARAHDAETRERAVRLDRQQRATRDIVGRLNAWLAGQAALEGTLAAIAAGAEVAVAWLDRAGRPRAASSPLGEGDGEGLRVLEAPIRWGDALLGTLGLGWREPDPPPDAALVTAIAEDLAIALVAERLVVDEEQRTGLASLLAKATWPGDEKLAVALAGWLRGLIEHQVALLLWDAGPPEQILRIAPEAAAPRTGWLREAMPSEPGPVAPDAVRRCPLLAAESLPAILGIPFVAEGGRVFGGIFLCRAAPFAEAELGKAPGLGLVVGSAFARMVSEERLRAAEQLAALGALGKLVAHEVRNPLNSLALHAKLLARRLERLALPADEHAWVAEHLAALDQEIGRTDRLVGEFVALCEADPPTTALADLRRAVADALARHEPALRAHDVEVVTRLPEASAWAPIDAAKLEHVLDHLLTNSVEAMADRPHRTLTVTLADRSDSWQLSIVDTGGGVAQPERLFKPVRSHKLDGHGLGLALSRHVVRLHHGDIIYDPHDEGSEFTVVLPRRYADSSVI